MARSEYHRADTHRRPQYLILLLCLGVMLYIISRLWNGSGGFLDHYLADLVALPIYIPLFWFLARGLGIIKDEFQIKISHIIMVALLFSILFEGLVPLLNKAATRDPLDILAYFIGGALVWFTVSFSQSRLSIRFLER